MSKKKRNKILTGIELAKLHTSGKIYGFAGPARVYAENAIPGENADIRVTGKQGDAYLGRVINLNRLSERRTNPVCSHFGYCGGCNWQHIDYGYQLSFKQQIVDQALQKYNFERPSVATVIPSPEILFYRNRLEYAFSSRRWYYEGEEKIIDPDRRKAMGFHMVDNSEKVVQIDHCWLQPEPGHTLVKAVEKFVRAGDFSFYDPKENTGLLRSLVIRITTLGETMLILVFAMDDPEKRDLLLDFLINGFPEIHSLFYTVCSDIRQNFSEGILIRIGNTAPFIYEECNNFRFRIGPSSFSQPNPHVARSIYRKITELAELKGNELVYDLYCGIGTISLHVASRARRVIGIEGSAGAVDDAVYNAGRNNMNNVSFVCGDVLATFTNTFVDEHDKPDLIILDPPRSGTLIEIKKTILYAAPDKIIYLSCNPVSLASDLRMLTIGYRISSVQPFDMFPQTHQVETLVLLEKEDISL